MRHLMSPLDFSVEELDKVLNLANDIEKNPEKYAHVCDGKIMATLFYEPSIFQCRFQFRCKRRERCRYHPRGFLLRRYLCHAPSERGGAACGIHGI